MSQYYPQQGPMYPPEQGPESDYYYDDEGDYEYYDDDDYSEGSGNTLLQSALAFFAGGCVVFLCMSFCGLGLAVLWITDAGGGTLAEPTPIPGSDVGLSFEDPAFSNEPVVNEQGLQVTILEVNRNASVETIPQAEGREILIITIELVNLGTEDNSFNERDFMLVNGFEAYASASGAVDGALGRGLLPPGEGLEGRLVFEIVADEFGLRMLWEPGGNAQPRYIALQ